MNPPKEAKVAALAVIALLASASATFAAGTPEQRRACRADAMRLCREFVPNVKRITACMEKNIGQLSPECRKQFK
jgi:hypothetical protein